MSLRQYALLLLCCLCLYLPGQFTLPVLDRDEARYAQASRQMHESGDYIDIRFQERPRYRKPVGIYWLQNLSLSLTGADPGAIWPYRIPSWLGISLAVLLTARLGSRLFDTRTGMAAGLLLGGSVLALAQARLASTDGALLACVVLAMERLQALLAGSPRGWWLFWLAVAAGVLLKGPIILLVVMGCMLALRLKGSPGLHWNRLRPLPGGLLMLAVVLPWVIAISLHSQGAFWQASVGGDLLSKVVGVQESHGAFPGAYAVMVWVAFWPGGLLLALGLPWIWQQRQDPRVVFLLAWLLPAWLVFELTPTKLPHYVMPLYPALALLTAAAWYQASPWSARALRWIAAPWLLGALLLPPGLVLTQAYLGGINAHLWITGIAACTLWPLAWWGWRGVANGQGHAPWRLALLGGSFALLSLGWMLPRAPAFWLSEAVAQQLQQLQTPDCPRYHLLAVHYHEPSLVFRLGQDTLLAAETSGVAEFLAGGDCRLALLPSGDWQSGEVLAQVRGFHYSKGRWLILDVVR